LPDEDVSLAQAMGNLLNQYAGMHFVCDARGTLIEKQSPAGEHRYQWEAFNRLNAATVGVNRGR
jgi:YD repeat-containing protein